MGADEDGDALMVGATIELMNGSCVRVLIPHDANPKVAVRQLEKLTKELSREPGLFEFAAPVPEQGDSSLPDRFPF